MAKYRKGERTMAQTEKRIFKVTIHHEQWKGEELVLAEDDIEARRIAVADDQDATAAADPEDIEPVLFCEVEYIGTPLAS